MSKFRKLLLGTALICAAGPVWAEKLGLGREALPEEIAAWDVKVMPDGRGLPEGSGSVEDGEMLFSENCAVCHGEFAEGVDRWPVLAGGEGTLADPDPVKTVGSYWPYLSTVYDYVHRSMPYGSAQTLSADDTYAITAYILYSNYLVEEDFVLSNENFLDVEMPNADNFIVDDRDEVELPLFTTEACMENCKETVEITRRAASLDVTPGEPDDEAPAEDAAEPAPVEAAQQEAAVEPEAEPEVAVAAADPALIAAGEKVFRKCAACHQVGDDAKDRAGPVLNGVVGRALGAREGFKYSKAMTDAGAEGVAWTEENLAEFLKSPRGFLKGTNMAFAGLKTDEDLKAITAYLASHQ